MANVSLFHSIWYALVMNKKILAFILVAISLLAVMYVLFSKKEPKNALSYPVTSKNETCKEGYVLTTIVTSEGERYSCDLTSSFSQGPRLIGSGEETYTLTGYYHIYKQDFYPLGYDATRGDIPSVVTCHGFVATAGNPEFINTYKAKINRLEKTSGNIVINLNDMSIGNPPIKILATTSPLSAKITESSPSKQITLDFMVRPFPERDTNPCDSHGIYIVSK